MVFFFKQKTAYEMRISDWSSDVCSSDLGADLLVGGWDGRGRVAGDGARGRQSSRAALCLRADRLQHPRRRAHVARVYRAVLEHPSLDLTHCPVRVERSRDTHRLWATTMGVSTSLDTSGIQDGVDLRHGALWSRSEEHTSELQSLMRISYAVFCLKKKKKNTDT